MLKRNKRFMRKRYMRTYLLAGTICLAVLSSAIIAYASDEDTQLTLPLAAYSEETSDSVRSLDPSSYDVAAHEVSTSKLDSEDDAKENETKSTVYVRESPTHDDDSSYDASVSSSMESDIETASEEARLSSDMSNDSASPTIRGTEEDVDAMHTREPEATDVAGENQHESDVSSERSESESESDATDADGELYVVASGLEYYANLGEYKGLSISYTPEEKESEENVEEALKEYQKEYTKYEEITDRTDVQEGDTVTISYVGTIDGEVVPDASCKDDIVTIGSACYLDGFEDGLIGANVGDTVTLNLQFPDYYSDEYAGKDIDFEVSIQTLSLASVPEIDDELAEFVTDGECTTLEEWEDEITDDLKKTSKAERKKEKRNLAWEQVLEETSITEYPDDVIQKYIEAIESSYQHYADTLGISLEELYGAWNISEKEIKKEAKKQFKSEVTAQAIAGEENIVVSDQELDEYIESLAESNEITVSEIKDEYEEEYLRNLCLYEKVYDFVYENTDFEEEE